MQRPPQSPYGAPPQGGQYGASPNQSPYGAPPHGQSSYPGQPPQQGYGQPGASPYGQPPQGQYGAPPQQQGMQGMYGGAPVQIGSGEQQIIAELLNHCVRDQSRFIMSTFFSQYRSAEKR